MNFNDIVKIFLPKDKVFYGLFEEISENLLEMAGYFKDIFDEEQRPAKEEFLAKLKAYEHKNDGLSHQVFIELGKNFITPFDREDIHKLAIALDDVADYIYACFNKIVIYNVDEYDDFMKKMVVVVYNAVEALAQALTQLRGMKHVKEIQEALITVNSIENEADELLNNGLSLLFNETDDAVKLIKFKEIYQIMEIITDKCEDAADIIESIIIKYS